MLKNCQECNKEFKTYPSEIKLGRGKFCSHLCYGKSKIGSPGYWLGKKRLHMTGEKHWFFGKHHTPEIIEKIINANLGKKQTEATREKRSLSLMGNKNALGCKYSESFKKKASERMKGISYVIGKHWKLSDETKKRMSEAHKGEKSPFWKGGITSIHQRIRASMEYRNWRESVFQRDDYTCVECNLKSGNGRRVILHADHIKPFAYFPELRFELSNGRTLCVDCHKQTDTYGSKAFNYIEVFGLAPVFMGEEE